MSDESTFFLVSYRDPKDAKVVSLKAKTIRDSNLGLSFVRLSDFIFETRGILVDPQEENLRTRFKNTKSLHLSIYSIVSIEEVGMENQGLHFTNNKSNVVVLPSHHDRPPERN